MTLAPGSRLGTWELVAHLGTGGMGQVWRARDLRLGRDVAVKVLPDAVAHDAAWLARFEREARTLAGVNHPNVVTLHSIEDEDGVRFLTMELVEGDTLDRFVAPGMPLARILQLAIPIAEALVAAHEKQVVHRDLKPGNVMVARDGRVKVVDFGLARQLAAAPAGPGSADASQAPTRDLPLSGEGAVAGTPPYMAPEQIRGEAVDARADVFALGVILYELAAARRPFGGATPAEVGAAILRDEPVPLATLRPDLPGAFCRLVSRCLAKHPRERLQTALDLGNELRLLRRAAERGESARPVPTAAGEAPSIAVLPFVNRSRDEEDEYFSDGLADELLNVLAKIRGLRVAARTSSFHFKGRDATIARIGCELNVATVLEGSVRKAGDRVRISVQLVKVADGYHLWSETYDRTLDDIFAVQDDIARSVVKELRSTLLGEVADSNASGEARAEVAAAVRGRSRDPEAHRLCLQGRYFVDRHSPADVARGIALLEQATALDPGFALAWAELGRARARQAYATWAPLEEGFARAREAVERSLALEPELGEAHATLGWIRMTHDWDWAGAEAAYRRALELAPGDAGVRSGAGTVALLAGRAEDGLRHCRLAADQDPLNSRAWHQLGLALERAGRFAESVDAFRKAIDLAPQRFATRTMLALILQRLGRPDEAIAMAAQEPEEAYRLQSHAILDHAQGREGLAQESLDALIANHGDTWAYQVAEVLASHGRRDEAFAWLDRAIAQRDSGLIESKTSACLGALHDDPRWDAFLAKIGMAG